MSLFIFTKQQLIQKYYVRSKVPIFSTLSRIARVITLTIIGIGIANNISRLVHGYDAIPEASVGECDFRDSSIFIEVIKNWWNMLNFSILLYNLSSSLRHHSEVDQRFGKKEHFTERIILTLNDVGNPIEHWPNGEFLMRGLNEVGFEEFWGARLIKSIFNVEGNHHLKDPIIPNFLAIRGDEIEWARLRDHIKNRLSPISCSDHIMRSMRLKIVDVKYVWIMTYECRGEYKAVNEKFRILLIRKSLLDKMKNLEFHDFCEAIPDKAHGRFRGCKYCTNDGSLCKSESTQDEYHKYFHNRWNMLRKIHEIDTKNGLTKSETSVHKNEKTWRILAGEIGLSGHVMQEESGNFVELRDDLVWKDY